MSEKLALIVPSLGESVSEAVISKWKKNIGDFVKQDELIVELETDKVTVEINAPKNGFLFEIKAKEGEKIEVGDILAYIKEDSNKSEKIDIDAVTEKEVIKESDSYKEVIEFQDDNKKITKDDILNILNEDDDIEKSEIDNHKNDRINRVKITKLRQTISRNLKEAQNNSAILTTFNEIDMSNVINLKNRVKESFEKKHNVKLGFMSFFLKACVNALREIPSVNSEVDGDEFIYKNFYDIGVAVGSEKGLMVPVIKDVDNLSFADIENEIKIKAKKARESKLTKEEMSNGTFTITNGGVYGSLMSTPILNYPQSGILGMHNIVKRPVVIDNEITIRPMMYVALSYDHRVIDGMEAVKFLVRIKELIEDPEKLFLEI